MAIFGDFGEMIGKGINSGFSRLSTGFKIADEMAGPNRFDERDAAKAKLLANQKAAADAEANLSATSKLAGSAYGAAFSGGQNIQSSINRTGKKSILGSF
jgi:hypothetical protein